METIQKHCWEFDVHVHVKKKNLPRGRVTFHQPGWPLCWSPAWRGSGDSPACCVWQRGERPGSHCCLSVWCHSLSVLAESLTVGLKDTKHQWKVEILQQGLWLICFLDWLNGIEIQVSAKGIMKIFCKAMEFIIKVNMIWYTFAILIQFIA